MTRPLTPPPSPKPLEAAYEPRRVWGLRDAQQVVYGRSMGRCEKCRTAWGEQFHHRQPRGMGGSRNPHQHSPANLIHLCRPCHEWVEAHSREAYEAGWKVRHGNTGPEQTPITRAGRTVWLHHNGTQTVVT